MIDDGIRSIGVATPWWAMMSRHNDEIGFCRSCHRRRHGTVTLMACDVIVHVDKIDPRVPQVYSFAQVSKTAYAGDSMFTMYMGPRHEL